ncbi:phage baseplate assembly protein V [Amycolatopsis kentuckyensis]|uniref:phage baseplate assembly protein V n=1 Tax=Amycolatopsis kentuckyensis TaxID=218823 RepID=UPI000A3AEB99|nr:phage baseplate assembly protein V [Amycolatopsis kentuckyensis]
MTDENRACYFGLYPALVTDIVDDRRQSRVQVSFPWLGGDGGLARYWATLLTPYADDDQGFVMLPAVDSQVVVGFEFGDLQRPYVVGSCWNGREMMPFTPTRPNNRRMIKSRSGARLEFDDSAGAATVTVASGRGHTVVIDDGAGSIEIKHANQTRITIDSGGMVSITTKATVDITAAALNVHAGTAVFDGMISCTNLIASGAVASPSYSPGAGNVW